MFHKHVAYVAVFFSIKQLSKKEKMPACLQEMPAAVRETGESRHQGGPIKPPPPQTPLTSRQ